MHANENLVSHAAFTFFTLQFYSLIIFVYSLNIGRAQYDYPDDEILSNRSHLNILPATHIRHAGRDEEYRDERDDRYPLQSSHLASGRRERSVEEYNSPHRGGGSNRRVLNAM